MNPLPPELVAKVPLFVTEIEIAPEGQGAVNLSSAALERAMNLNRGAGGVVFHFAGTFDHEAFAVWWST